ncbi:MAG: type IV pilus modification protein PilV [Oceanospirillaceae bacterium]|nr:type IV pilus modification protein PilV [Oceanospirillaceae bacterium]
MKMQRGTSLIEVLVTVLVISVGLLGMASLQLSAIALNQSAYQRLQAVNLAYEIADSIFVNSTQAEIGYYVLPSDPNNIPPGNSVAAEDIATWLAAAARRLPNGRVLISDPLAMTAAGNVRIFTITICWEDKKASLELPNTCDATNQAMFSFSASSRT